MAATPRGAWVLFFHGGPMLRIKDWERLFENHRSKEIKNLEWVAMPNTHGSKFLELMDHPEGPQHFAAWVLIVQVASKCGNTAASRGILRRGDGTPHTPRTLSLLTRCPEPIFVAAIRRLLVLKWLEDDEIKPISGHDAGIPRGAAGKSREVAGIPPLQDNELQDNEEQGSGSGGGPGEETASPGDTGGDAQGEGEEDSPPPKSFPKDSTAYKAAHYLGTFLLPRWVPSAKPVTEAWIQRQAKEADLMLRIDERSFDDINRIFAKIHNQQPGPTGFLWRKNILSMGKLRKQWNDGKLDTLLHGRER